MAKRGVTLDPGYRPGSHWATCDRDGFQYRAEDLKKTWDGLWVNDQDYEPRHPQDFLRVKAERVSVSQPIRPESIDNVVSSATTIGGITTTAATFGQTSAVAGVGEAGRGICGTDDGIPTATFGLIQALRDPS